MKTSDSCKECRLMERHGTRYFCRHYAIDCTAVRACYFMYECSDDYVEDKKKVKKV